MDRLAAPLSPDAPLMHLFSSRAAMRGEEVRRKVRDVERYAGRARFLRAAQHRGCRVLENAGQFIDIYNREPIRRLL